jgi:hypothetical protein
MGDMTILRKSAAITVAGALALAGLVGASTSAVGGKETVRLTPTGFGLEASGYASKMRGGQVPTGSDKVAYAVVACTNEGGVENTNAEADGDLDNGMAFQGASTRAWTTTAGAQVSSWSRHRIDKVRLVGSPLGELNLQGIVATSHAWHDATGFHGESSSSLGAIIFEPAVGEPQTFPVPSPGQAVTVPGVAEISLGVGNNKTSADGAATNINALRVHSLLTQSTSRIGHTHAAIDDGVKSALYGGSAYATKLTALNDLLTSGRTVPTSVPCVGTDGDWTDNHANDTDLSGNLLASGLTSRQQSGRTAPGGRPEVTAASRVGLVDLGGGLEVQMVKAKAHVMKTASGYTTDIAGTSIGGVTYNGTEQEFPEGENVMEIPGVATLERAIVEQGPRSISVTGLRVTLLEGTEAVGILDLGFAKAALQPSGL